MRGACSAGAPSASLATVEQQRTLALRYGVDGAQLSVRFSDAMPGGTASAALTSAALVFAPHLHRHPPWRRALRGIEAWRSPAL